MTGFLRWLKRTLRWWWRFGIALTLISIVIIALIPASTIQLSTVWDRVAFATSPQHFDFVQWEWRAIGAKADALLFGQSAYMTEADRSDYVQAYMRDLAELQALEARITTLYTDPTQTPTPEQLQPLQQERDHQRADLRTRQSTAEAILEGQVAAVLVEQGFGVLGQLLPPMAMRFTGMPNLLVTSPRSAIRMENSLVVDPMPIDERVQLEDQLMAQYDVSALVVPLGGIALYPAMIHESSNLSFVIETFAHEWLHHYLYFHPLGLSYFAGEGFAGEARIINETTADLFGKEIASLVIARYYPELTPPTLPTYNPTRQSTPTPDPDTFDFASAMNETRVTVDALLAQGEVARAEAYMEARRAFFYENGYSLRRINQAFFAFYGGYQAGGGMVGAGGADPIGPAVLAIRESSESIHAFIVQMRTITTREGLLRLQEDVALEN
ncbi:MAG: hypothetical protein ACFE0Q_16025 [Anaerolineae bacterium]